MSDVKPALTPEQWAEEFSGKWRRVREGQVFLDPKYGLSAAYDAGCASVTLEDPHAAAALALHDQPLGFTWDDVHLLRYWGENVNADNASRRRAILDLADRIAALLPPREDEGG